MQMCFFNNSIFKSAFQRHHVTFYENHLSLNYTVFQTNIQKYVYIYIYKERIKELLPILIPNFIIENFNTWKFQSSPNPQINHLVRLQGGRPHKPQLKLAYFGYSPGWLSKSNIIKKNKLNLINHI